MSYNTKEPLITNDPLSYYTKGVRNDINERTHIGTTDILVRKSSRGSQFSIHSKYKYNPNYLNYVGDWNISASYSPNDVVSVFNNKIGNVNTPEEEILDQIDEYFKGGVTKVEEHENYTTYFGVYKFYKSDGSEDGDINTTIVIPKILPVPGTYVCVSPVPRLDFLENLVHDIGNFTFTNPVFLPYVRINGTNEEVPKLINYFPQYPEPEVTAILELDDPVHASSVGAYWRMLSLYDNGSGEGCQCRYH